MKNCCVIGLGYIGLPTAAILADNNYKVFGVDINQKIISKINKGEVHINEPNLENLVRKVIEKKLFEAISTPISSDIFLITVPTPCLKNDLNIPQPNIKYVLQAVNSIIPVVKEGDLIILESTCPVGTTNKIKDLISKKINFSINDIKIAYCPERVIPGNIINELLENDRVIGGINKNSKIAAKDFYESFCKGKVEITNDKTAEMVKLTENAFRDVNIAFANELSLICDELGIDVYELIELSNHHPRVNILKPGCGVGGHCIAIDPWFIASKSPDISHLIQTARKVNDNKPQWVMKKIISASKSFRDLFNRKPTIGLLGLTFKPDVDDLRESPSLEICNRLIGSGENVIVCEPNLTSYKNLQFVSTNDILNKADIFVLLVLHKQFKDMEIDSKYILDFCGFLKSNVSIF